MPNQICAYVINNPTIFAEMVTLSGLTQPDTLIRLSPERIDGLANTIGCLTRGGIDAFVSKYPNISGDCYVALTSDGNGNSVLALDILRPDKGGAVIDQDIIYIRNPNSESVREAEKLSHFDHDGRTFDTSAYNTLSGYLENRRDIPVTFAEIKEFDPGIFETISAGLKQIEGKEAI